MSSIYRKGEVLGWGSVAVVYRGWDELLDRPVAIKELVQPFATCAPFSRAFRTRALKVLDLSSRYLLATYAADVDRSIQAVVRELGDETVGQRSFQGPLEPEAIPKLLRHVLAGLDVLHGRGLVHGAVKPENIFLCGADYKVGDFGLPAIDGAPAAPLSRFRYSSPEEIREPERVSCVSDIYSLGVVAYELILGPLRLKQVVEELARDVDAGASSSSSPRSEQEELWPRFHSSTIELPPIHVLEPGVPAALSLTLQKMVAKDLSARFPSCKKALASLGAANSEIPTGSQNLSIAMNVPASVGTASPSTSAPPARPATSWAWAGGGALAVAALVAGGFLIFGERNPANTAQTPPITRTGAGSPAAVDRDRATPEDELPDRLIRLAASEGLSVGLEPARSPGRPRLALGAPIRFRVESDREGYLLLFALSPDGSITCLYPNAERKEVTIAPSSPMRLPSEADRQAGLDLVAQEPPGRELVFAVVSTRELPPLPSAAEGLLREYPAGEPARTFTDWLEGFFQESGRETRMAVLDFEVGADQ